MATDIRATAARLRFWSTLLLLFVTAVMVLEIAARAGAFEAGRPEYQLGLALFFTIPMLFYLAALLRIRRAFGAIAGGAMFTPEVAAALRHAGLWLALGAVIALLINPLIQRLADEDYPRLIEYDVATLIIAAVGIAMTFIARLFGQAVRLQRELDEIF